MSSSERLAIAQYVRLPVQRLLAVRDAIAVDNLRSWMVRGGAAICEQGLFAGSHFLLNVILARSLSAEGYGAFAFSATVLLVLIGFHNALVLEPAAVLEPSRYEPRASTYCRAQLLVHAVVSAVAAAAVGIAGLVVLRTGDTGHLGWTLIAAAAASPFILLFWLARRFLYVLSRPGAALIGSACYLLCVCSAAVLLHWQGGLTPGAAFALMAIGGTVSAAFMLWRAGAFRRDPGQRRFTTRALLRERWDYGRWLIGVVLAEIAVAPAIVLITTSMLGLAAVGVLRAMQTFVLPLGHAVLAIVGIVLPHLARDFERRQLRGLAIKSKVLAATLVTAALAIECALIAFHPELERLLYGGKFAEYSFLIPLFGLVTVFESLSLTYSSVLSAVRQSRLIFRSVLITAPISLVLAFLCISRWGLQGAVLSFTAAAATAAVMRGWLASPWVSANEEPV